MPTSIEVTDEQVCDAIRTIVDEEMPEAVRNAVLRHADTVIKNAVNARIGPVIDEMLTQEKFVTGRYDDARPLDDVIKGAVRAYLDQRVFLYSAKDDRPSERLKQTSSSNGSPTRLEAFLRFSIERYCDEHLNAKLTPVVESFVAQRGGIEQVAREQMAKLLHEKFKL